MKSSNVDNLSTGVLIRKLRANHQMSQQELADRAGVSFSFVNQVEGGKPTVRLDALNKLLKVFEIMLNFSVTSLRRKIASVACVPTHRFHRLKDGKWRKIWYVLYNTSTSRVAR